jgi:PAS domain S-box-containing protein
LRKDEPTYRSLLELAAEGIIVVDGDGRIVLANNRSQELFGYQAEELLGQELEILLPESRRQIHREHRARYLENPHNRPMGTGLDLIARRKDGAEFPVEISLSYVGTGDDMLIMASVLDITQRRALEQGLRDSEARHHSLIDAILDSTAGGIIIRDADRRVGWFNRALEEFFGVRRAEAINEDIRNLVQFQIGPAIEDPQALLRRVSELGTEEVPGEVFVVHILQDEGRPERWVEHRSDLIVSGVFAGGRIDHFYDITEIKIAEEARARLMDERIRQLEEELACLDRLKGPQETSVTAASFGASSVRERFPDTFRELVATYGEIIDLALEQHSYKVDNKVAEKLRDMAETLASLKGGPRDVIDICTSTLKNLTNGALSGKARAYMNEGRLIILELMGYLVSSYRNLAGTGRQGSVRPGKGDGHE